ncbi:hypothetical protein D3C85_1566330 [compost metagenome]
MQNHRDDHHKTNGRNVRGRTGHHGADDRQNADHRKSRQIVFHGLHDAREQVMDNQTKRNGNHHDLQDRQQHPHHVHLNMRIHVQTCQQRRGNHPHQR